MAPTLSRVARCRDGDKACLIAIAYNAPERPPVKPISTTIGDAEALRQYLLKQGYLEHNITFLRDDSQDAKMLPTKPNILRAMGEFMEDIKPGDRRFFFYGGHGYQIVCNENTEDDDMDEVILTHEHSGEPQDAQGRPLDPAQLVELPPDHPDKKKLEGIITDNMLRELLVDKLLPGCRLVAVFDTCHSGTMLDLDFHWKYEDVAKRYVTVPARGRSFKARRLAIPDMGVTLKPDQDPKHDHSYTVDGRPMLCCSSPEMENFPPEVYCIASAEDSQRSWGFDNITMTQTLLGILNNTPRLTIRQLMQTLHDTLGSLRASSFKKSIAFKKLKRSQTSIENYCKRLNSIQLPQFGSLVRTAPDKHFSI